MRYRLHRNGCVTLDDTFESYDEFMEHWAWCMDVCEREWTEYTVFNADTDKVIHHTKFGIPPTLSEFA